MKDSPTPSDWLEDIVSLLPAVTLLQQIGYTYLTPTQALAQRGNKRSPIILTDILTAQLRRLNQIEAKGKIHPFSEANIQAAVDEIAKCPYNALYTTSQHLYDLITLGKSFDQTIDGDKKSYSLNYIDWHNPANNVYHITDEFEIERCNSTQTRRPDLVLFVNGIPLVAIECKRPDLKDAVDRGISQHLRNHRLDEIPHFFCLTQILLAVSQNAAQDGTTATDKEFWAVWKEEDAIGADTELATLINTPLSSTQTAAILSWREPWQQVKMTEIWAAGTRQVSTQDRAICSLLTPARLLELIYGYIIFDAGTKKIARYQQYFAVVQLTATASDAGNDTLTYNWYINGATTPISGQTIDYNFANSGSYPVKLDVIDSNGAITTQTINVTINNVAPTINQITIPTNITEGETIQLQATASDAGNDVLTYNWYINNATTPINGATIDYTFTNNGIYPVKLEVIDTDGAITTQTIDVTVTNVAPTIVNIAKPTTIKEGESVTFSATATDPGILDTLTYSWNFGDNTNSVTGQNVNHTFADNGNYNVVLTVTDKDGAVTTQTVIAKVDNVAPTIVSIVKPATIKEGESVVFTATATDPGILDTLTYSWNFGDNTNPIVGQNVNHTFVDNGNYNVTLTVTDKDGAATTQTVVTKVDNVAPTIVSIVKPTTIKEGESVTFAATVTDPGILDTLTYSWTFGDSTPAVSGQNVNHTFADNGTYNVVLTVTDKDGGITSQTVVAKVDNVAPSIVSIAKPATIKEGESVIFAAIATDPGILDTLTYSWNFGDNTTIVSGQTVTHTFVDNGIYNVILTVTDKDGAATTQTVVAKVDNVAPTIISIVKPTVAAPPTTGGIRAGGNITINGSADFDGNTTNRTDDTQIYAGKGISLNGNVTLPVKRDAAGNPLKVNGKIVLTDNEITLGTGATTTTNPNQYTNFTTATQTINIPAYADRKLQEFTPLASAVVKTFNVQTTPINTSADWNTKFPAAGTVTNPTVVRIINGDLNLPANINLSNYILIVENGNINFYQGNPVLNNVKLIANAGNINLNSTTGTNLSLSASGNINITGNTSLGGTSIINSNGNITTNGGLSMVNSTATVKMVAQGDLTVNGNTSLKGQLFTKKNMTINGQTTIIGSLDALLNVSIGGNTTILAK